MPLIVPPETLPVVVKFSSPKDIVPLLSVIEPSVSVKFPASTVAASTKGVVNSVVIVTFAGKPIVNVSVALTTASISFEVPKILIVSPAPTCCLVEEASSIKKPAAADTWADNSFTAPITEVAERAASSVAISPKSNEVIALNSVLNFSSVSVIAILLTAIFCHTF